MNTKNNEENDENDKNYDIIPYDLFFIKMRSHSCLHELSEVNSTFQVYLELSSSKLDEQSDLRSK